MFYIHIFSVFRKLLNSRFQFYTANPFLSQARWLNKFSLALTFLTLAFLLIVFSLPEFRGELLYGILLVGLGVYGLATILVGITYILFAVEISHLSQNVQDKLLGAFARTLTFTGWLIATVVLAPLGFLLSVLTDVLLGSIFLRTARES